MDACISDVIALPSVLVLDNSGISSIGDTAKLKEMCPNVTELDLTKNSITNWGEVWYNLVHYATG